MFRGYFPPCSEHILKLVKPSEDSFPDLNTLYIRGQVPDYCLQEVHVEIQTVLSMQLITLMAETKEQLEQHAAVKKKSNLVNLSLLYFHSFTIQSLISLLYVFPLQY